MIEFFIKLYEKLYNAQPDVETHQAIKDTIESNGLAQLADVPFWFQEFWQAILAGKVIGKQHFMTDEILKIDADLVNCMAELAEIIDMNYDNYGEGITMKFFPLKLKTFICLEGGPGTCFYSIENLDN